MTQPARTLPAFPMTQASCEEQADLDGLLTEYFVVDDDATLVQHFLDIALAQE